MLLTRSFSVPYSTGRGTHRRLGCSYTRGVALSGTESIAAGAEGLRGQNRADYCSKADTLHLTCRHASCGRAASRCRVAREGIAAPGVDGSATSAILRQRERREADHAPAPPSTRHCCVRPARPGGSGSSCGRPIRLPRRNRGFSTASAPPCALDTIAGAPRKPTSRLPADVIERWRATGPGWQTRMAQRLSKVP
jgi:hypothetical protein